MTRSHSRLVALALVGVVVLWIAIASAHPLGGLGTPIGSHTPEPLPTPTSTSLGQAAGHGEPAVRPLQHHPVLAKVLEIAKLVSLALLVAAFAWISRRVVKRVQLTNEVIAPPTEDDTEPPVVALADLQQATDDSLDDLRTNPDVGGAIAACWRRFEDLAADSGAAREPWQTTTEFVVEVLGRTRAPRADLEDLAILFQETVYATTPPGEDGRQRAVKALVGLQEALSGQVPSAAGEEVEVDDEAH